MCCSRSTPLHTLYTPIHPCTPLYTPIPQNDDNNYSDYYDYYYDYYYYDYDDYYSYDDYYTYFYDYSNWGYGASDQSAGGNGGNGRNGRIGRNGTGGNRGTGVYEWSMDVGNTNGNISASNYIPAPSLYGADFDDIAVQTLLFPAIACILSIAFFCIVRLYLHTDSCYKGVSNASAEPALNPTNYYSTVTCNDKRGLLYSQQQGKSLEDAMNVDKHGEQRAHSSLYSPSHSPLSIDTSDLRRCIFDYIPSQHTYFNNFLSQTTFLVSFVRPKCPFPNFCFVSNHSPSSYPMGESPPPEYFQHAASNSYRVLTI